MRTHRKALQDRFVEAVLSGRKNTTIRPAGRPSKLPEAGDKLTLFRWTGRPYWSPQEVVGEFRIKRIWSVTVSEEGLVLEDGGTRHWAHQPCGDQETFAHREGFLNWAEMREWFRTTHGLPFSGIMIEWDRTRLEGSVELPIS
ncbi:MAG: hypothetical protein J0L84_10005 [Verrucomicrobia bacterium]|nr:hypothetical protein [Verrucomicrobiota bacterium]